MSAEARLRGLVDALSAGDLDVLNGALAPVFYGYEPGPGEPDAVERITDLVAGLRAAMPDLTVTLDDITPSEDGFTATATIAGTSSNPLWGAPPTGERVTWTNPISIRPVGEAFAFRFDDLTLPAVIEVLRQVGMINPPDEMDRPLRAPIVFPEFLMKVLFTGQAGDKACSHLDQIQVVEPATRMCAPCVAEGTIWPALRMCLICGHVGCCDTSTNKHANQHYQDTGHPLMRSIRMDEGWVWCYEDSAFFEKRTLDRYR